MRLFGFRDTIAHDMNTRGRVVTKVDAVVEAHKEGVGISGNDGEHLPHTVSYQMSLTIFRRSLPFWPTSAGVRLMRGEVERQKRTGA
jgi:hypothetical protein